MSRAPEVTVLDANPMVASDPTKNTRLRMSPELKTWLDFAQQARSRGEYSASLEYLQATSGLHPDHLQVKMEIAADLRELGRLDEAEAALREVIERKPQHCGALMAL